MVNVDIGALRSIEREKEISFETVIDALETALLTAYKHTPHSMPHARVVIDRKTGEVVVWAQDIGPDGELVEEYDDTPSDFGRVAAMTARQVILQRLRDAEHDQTFGEYYGRRTHPNLVKKLFALEVPEIADGSVEIVGVAREAGHRTKIAVRTSVPGLNAKGACIGPMGQRVRNVVAELHGEKIDIIDWAEEPAAYVGNALSPAHIVASKVVDPATQAVRVVVHDFQLSLAIGREGQNARLAARLTGWRIDIHSDAEADPMGSSARHGPTPAAPDTPSSSPESGE